MVTQFNNYEFEIFKKFSSHEAYPIAEEWLEHLKALPRHCRRGRYQAHCAAASIPIDHIELVLAVVDLPSARRSILDALFPVYIQEEHEASITALQPSGIKMVVWLAPQAQFIHKLLQTTGSEDHLQQLANLGCPVKGWYWVKSVCRIPTTPRICGAREEIYAALGLPWIPPELRESGIDVGKHQRAGF